MGLLSRLAGRKSKVVALFFCSAALFWFVATRGIGNNCKAFRIDTTCFNFTIWHDGPALEKNFAAADEVIGVEDKGFKGVVTNYDDATATELRSAEDIRKTMYLRFLNSNGIADKSRSEKKEKRLPDVIGIGVEKCGSGPLQWMMIHHPMIVGSVPIELHFFDTNEKLKKGKEYYKSLMPEVASFELASEKSPAYFNFGSRYLPNSMKGIVPDAKLIAILCDPVNRTYSDFVQEKIMKSISSDENFDALVDNLLSQFSKMPLDDDSAAINFIYKIFSGKSHIISTGLYYYHLIRWFKTYGRSQIHIVDGEELLSDPGSVMEKVQDFLGIPKLILKEDFVRSSSGFYCINAPIPSYTGTEFKLKKSNEPDCMSLDDKGRTRMGRWKYNSSHTTVERLRKFYAPYNEKLYALLGRRFNWQQPTP